MLKKASIIEGVSAASIATLAPIGMHIQKKMEQEKIKENQRN